MDVLNADAAQMLQSYIQRLEIHCRQRGYIPNWMQVDHNLMRDAFGGIETGQALGIKFELIPLECGLPYLVIMLCENTWEQFGITTDGHVDRISEPR